MSDSTKPRLKSSELEWAGPRILARIGDAAKDAYANARSNTGFGSSSQVQGGYYFPYRLSLDYQDLLWIYRGSWIARAIIDTIPEDMLKEFPALISQVAPEQIAKFNRMAAATRTLQKTIEGLKWGRLFGGALGIIILAGEDQHNLTKPLKVEDVLPDTYRGLIIVDRWSGVSPSSELISDIENASEYGLPQYYDVTTETSQSFRVHHSRCLRFTGRDLPLFEKQIQTYWGMSEIEAIFEELRRRDFVAAGIADLVSRAHVLAMREPMLAQILSGANLTQQQQLDYAMRMKAVSESIGTNGIFAIGENAELFPLSYSFAGLKDISDAQMEAIAGASGIPMSRWGRSITGLGNSGEGELQVYYDSIDQKRQREMRPIFDKLLPIMCMSAWGMVPEDFDYRFAPVRTMSAKERSELAKNYTEPVYGAVNLGAFGRQTLLRELQTISKETGVFTNITDEMIANADDTPMMGDVPGAGEDAETQPGGDREDGVKDEATAEEGMAIYHGLAVTIENRKGEVRKGKNWKSRAAADYGFIHGVIGADGDELDCYVGPDHDSSMVYVVDQSRLQDVGFDEHKVMLGFTTAKDAREAFLKSHDRGDQIFMNSREFTMPEFRRWIREADLSKPATE